jgi:hypothetical protein
MVNTTRRKYQRFQVKMPILVNGVDKVGHAFRLAAETVNGSVDGLALLLVNEPSPFSSLLDPFLIKSALSRFKPTYVMSRLSTPTRCWSVSDSGESTTPLQRRPTLISVHPTTKPQHS